MIEVYAITDVSGPPLPKVSSLHAIAAGELAAICADATTGEVTPNRLWRHEEVVEALMTNRDVLPVRYGTQVADESSVRSILEQHYERLRERLDAVRGSVEVSVRAFSDRLPTDTGGEFRSGTEYLRTRARTSAVEGEAVRVIHGPLAAAARADHVRRTSLPGEVLCAAYLLDRDAIDHFRAQVAELERINPGFRLTCTGPWPPYSFADE